MKTSILRVSSISIILILLLWSSVGSSFAATISGKVIGVADGDTITILDSAKKQHIIRLYGIDCPEDGQPFGKAAKKLTAQLTAGKTVVVTLYDIDKYQRIVGVVNVNCFNVNQRIIEAGLGWQYRKYCKASFCEDWLSTETEAKLSNLGLWKDNDPVPPWEWRKGARNSSYQMIGSTFQAAASSYHGNVQSHKFHSPGCRYYNCKNCTRVFSSREEAISAGYSPCGNCRP